MSKSVTDRYLRPILADLFSQCTEEQQANFLRAYPDGVEGMAEYKIPSAIALCERTIKNNEAISKPVAVGRSLNVVIAMIMAIF